MTEYGVIIFRGAGKAFYSYSGSMDFHDGMRKGLGTNGMEVVAERADIGSNHLDSIADYASVLVKRLNSGEKIDAARLLQSYTPRKK